MKDIHQCYVLPEPSTSTISGVKLEFPGRTLSLYFDFDRKGSMFTGGIIFNHVRAHKHTAESHCPASKIEASYDKLIKVADSQLVRELLDNTSTDQLTFWTLNHFMIYFDGDGCYEVIAEDWEALAVEAGSLQSTL